MWDEKLLLQEDLIRFLWFVWLDRNLSIYTVALSQQNEASAAFFLPYLFSGLFASRLYAASDLISVYSKPPFNRGKRQLTQIKMAAYSTLHLAHLLHLFFLRQMPSHREFYTLTPRFSPSRELFRHRAGSEQSPAVDTREMICTELTSAVSLRLLR